ncbi:hypothetical protein QW060_08450 [Myroides ceti]|uniref:Uncharacterized protein n=1 Tax=Paenimyroides ceti TaxID=395087 RepID=A0ABT8CRM2_9FLAO|nr:hypothetical protein [Paenimyroides ceti]MDN3707164.1 hypothetical protein [Paenimyroides ceti]
MPDNEYASSHAIGVSIPTYCLVVLKITSFQYRDLKQKHFKHFNIFYLQIERSDLLYTIL